MKIAIWGTKKEAIYLFNNIDKNNKVICFIDNNTNKQGRYINGLRVYSLAELQLLYPNDVDVVILALRNGYSIMEIIEQLKRADIKNVGIMKPSAYDFNERVNLATNSNQILWLNILNKPLMGYLQVILIKNCNLNCKGCTHFANLFNLKDRIGSGYDIEELKRDLNIISNNVEVFRLRLLGGEPLLYENLKEAIKLSRSFFPHSDIRIVTNGLLLLKASSDLLDCIYENDIGLDISLYKPTAEIREKIEDRLKQLNIKYCFENIESKYIEKFEKNIEINKKNIPYQSMQSCKSKQCQTLMEGKLYKCPFEALSYVFFDYFKCETEKQKEELIV